VVSGGIRSGDYERSASQSAPFVLAGPRRRSCCRIHRTPREIPLSEPSAAEEGCDRESAWTLCQETGTPGTPSKLKRRRRTHGFARRRVRLRSVVVVVFVAACSCDQENPVAPSPASVHDTLNDASGTSTNRSRVFGLSPLVGTGDETQERRLETHPSRKCRNWQTHQLEGLAVAIPWGSSPPCRTIRCARSWAQCQ
jgi:hypothetical protein